MSQVRVMGIALDDKTKILIEPEHGLIFPQDFAKQLPDTSLSGILDRMESDRKDSCKKGQ